MHARSSIPHAIAALCLAFAVPATQAAKIIDDSIIRTEGPRKFHLAVPARAVAGRLPLVIMLHGHGMSGASMMHPTAGWISFRDPALAWLEIVDREGILYLAPDGWKGSDGKRGWNDCRADAPTNPNTDDIGFIRALIDKAVAEHHADPARVYVIGISNGGSMAWRAAIELAPRIAAVSVLSALMPAKSLCQAPSTPMSVLVAHGTADPIAPYDGGKIGFWLLRGRGSGIGIDESVRIWRDLDRLPPTPEVTTVPHRDPEDMTTLTSYLWGEAPAGLQVKLYKVIDGGHNQPSTAYRLPWLLSALVGKQNGDVEFAEEAWAFFKDKRIGIPLAKSPAASPPDPSDKQP
jgi:polyhydroxybutyrate depolymerase